MAGKADGSVIIDTKMNTSGFHSGMVNMKNSFGNMSSTLSKLGKIMAGVFAVKQLVQFGKEAVALGSDLAEVQNVVDVTFESLNGEINEFAKNAITQFGLSETAAKQYTSTMGAMLKSMGFTTREAADMGKTMTGLAADMASFYNLDAEDAFYKIRAGISGETEPLKQLGINLSVANLEQYALTQGITKSYQAMNQQEQTLLRYNYLLSVTSDAQGDFARTSSSWANQTRILSERFNALKATIGQGLINVFTPVIRLMNTLLGKIQEVANAFLQFTSLLTGASYTSGSTGGGGGTAQISSMVPDPDDLDKSAKGMKVMSIATENAADATKKAAKEQKEYLSGLDEIRKYTPDNDATSSSGSGGSGGSGGGGGGGLGSLGAGTGGLLGDLNSALGTTESAVNKFAENISQKMQDLVEKIKLAWETADFTEIGQIVGTKIKKSLDEIDWDSMKSTGEKISKSLATFINGFVETPGLWDTVGNAIANGFNTALGTFNTFIKNVHWDSIGSAISISLQSVIQNIDYKLIGETFSNLLVMAFDLTTGIIEGVDWESLPSDIAKAIIETIQGFDFARAFESVGRLIGAAIVASIKLAEGLNQLVQDAIKAIKDYFAKYGVGWDKDKTLMENGKQIIVGIFNGIVDFIKNVGTWIKDNIITPFIDGYLKAYGTSLSEIKELGKKIIDAIFNGVSLTISSAKTWVKENILQPISNAFDSAGTFLKDTGETIWNGITEGIDNAKKTISVTFSAVVDRAFTTAKEAFDAVKNSEAIKTIKGAINNAFEKAKEAFDALKNGEAIKKIKGEIGDTFNNAKEKFNALRNADAIKKIRGEIANTFNNVRDKFNDLKNATAVKTIKGVMNSTFKKISDTYNKLKSKTISITAKIKAIWTGITSKVKKLLGLSTGGIYKNGKWQPIQGYASGGNPRSARLFYANENGIPELVGRIGNDTAVMNNSQIVASVAAGVYQAVVSAFGQMQNYFASMSNSMADIPVALENLSLPYPNVKSFPQPYLAQGTVVPPMAGMADKATQQQVQKTLDGLNSLINQLNGMNGQQTGRAGTNNTYSFTAQINRRTLFEEIMTEAELVRGRTGRNPFEMA